MIRGINTVKISVDYLPARSPGGDRLRLGRTLCCLLVLLSLSMPGSAADYDLVLLGGRVMDPETQLDAVRNVAISGGQIVEISEARLEGTREIDASGLVVAPGFIDLHAHGQTNQANEYQARDGVTTALELESGVPNVADWLASRRGKALINYGASASHAAARALAKQKYAARLPEYEALVSAHGADSDEAAAFLRETFGQAMYDSLTSAELDRMTALLAAEFADGALGIGLPLGYEPGATWQEILRLFEFAADRQAIIFVHTRESGIPGIQEVIANAAVTGAPLHIVHINSMALGHIEHAVDLVEAAQARGLDVTTEMYPYTAGSTSLESALFDEGWQSNLGGISYEDLQWQDTGERLTSATFETYRAQGGVVIIHMMKEDWIDAGINRASTMIASDGMPYAPGAHPRSAGTFSRVLGRYVREREALDLMTAIAKMTLMPAQRLADITPQAARKGRLQVGADADVTVFDPATVIDKATFTSGLQYSEGVAYVLVGGVLVVDEGENVPEVYPGQALLGKHHNQP